MMKKYTEIYPDGQRAYQFVADTAYVRESGTKGEHKAAEYILKTAEQVAAMPGKAEYIQTCLLYTSQPQQGSPAHSDKNPRHAQPVQHLCAF